MRRIYAEIVPKNEITAESINIRDFVGANLKEGRCIRAFAVDDESDIKTRYREYLAFYAMVADIKAGSAPLTFAEYRKMEEEI